MDQTVEIKLVKGSTFGRYPTVSGSRLYNYYISDDWLIDFPGWKRVLNLTPNSEGRGSFVSERGNIAICVTNNVVWNISPQLGATFVGLIGTSFGPVFMDENLNGQICIVDQATMYIYNRFTNALTIQTANIPDWLIPNSVCFHDTYFLIGNADTTGNGARWGAFSFLDDNNIELTYELAFQTKPDLAKAIVRLPQKGGNVLVFGKAVAEIQTNVGGLQGYQRLLTINIDYGTPSVATIASMENYVAWLAVNEKTAPVLMYFDGAEAHTISTDGISHLLESINKPDKSFGYFYTKDGHMFYVLTFYDFADNFSIAYDFKTQSFSFPTDAKLEAHPARGVWYFNNKTYFLNYKNGAVYNFSTDIPFFNENIGKELDFSNIDMMPRQIIGDTFRIGGAPNPFTATCFYLTLEQGTEVAYSELYAQNFQNNYLVSEDDDYLLSEDGQQLVAEGQATTAYYRPGVDLSFSKDGAITFSNDVRRNMNYEGYRENIMQWEQMGWMNNFTPKIKVWSYGRSVVKNAMLAIQT